MSSPEEREAVRLNFAVLTKNLNPKEIIDDMRQQKLLTENEHSDVETKTKENRRDGVSALLKALQRRKPGSLTVFIDLLKKVDGSEYLATKLAADLGAGEGRLLGSHVRACGGIVCYQSGCSTAVIPLLSVCSLHPQC